MLETNRAIENLVAAHQKASSICSLLSYAERSVPSPNEHRIGLLLDNATDFMNEIEYVLLHDMLYEVLRYCARKQENTSYNIDENTETMQILDQLLHLHELK